MGGKVGILAEKEAGVAVATKLLPECEVVVMKNDGIGAIFDFVTVSDELVGIIHVLVDGKMAVVVTA